MNLFRLVRTAGLLSLMAVGFTGCLSEPSYSTTPEISFNNISRQRYSVNGSIVDSVFITINFQDGDGDLGLSSTEATVAPYTPTYYGANFYMTPFVKNTTGTYTALQFARPDLFLTVNSFYDRFDHPSTTTDNRAAPLRGTLRRAYAFLYGSPFLPNQEVKFTVSIFDRALHQSNEIETTSIVFPVR
jgi:hypothetical protein